MDNNMIFDLLLQAFLLLLVAFFFLSMHNIPQKLFAKLRQPSRRQLQAKRHFVRGAQLLSQAKSPSNSSRSSSNALAKQAEEEADKAIAVDPTDAASHILKALSLDFQGFKTSALDALNTALSPLAAKSLSEGERGDALFKRADVVMGMNRARGRVDSAIEDLTRAIELSKDNARAYCLLGECYEMKKMNDEAKCAYEKALSLQPEFAKAKQAVDRLGVVD